MGYIVVEIQKNSEGQIAILSQAYNTKADADQMYYTALAAAAKSSLPVHAVTMLTETGLIEKTEHYARDNE